MFLNLVRDGAVLHLNGYKIAGPSVMGRCVDESLRHLFIGYGYDSIFVSGDEPEYMHQAMAAACDRAYEGTWVIQQAARQRQSDDVQAETPLWLMIVLRNPKGWTGPKEVGNKICENFWRSHQVPVAGCRENRAHREILET